ncbi:MAG: hypothetical protein ABI790_01290 [Betaproteobacteria bacterium]
MKIGILVASALATIYLVMFVMRGAPRAEIATPALVRAVQVLKIAQTEKFQSDLHFAESNAEALQLVGGSVRLGRIDGASQVAELNVREGGVIELLLDEKAKDGRVRAIFLPVTGETIGSEPLQWQCLSANWESVAGAGLGCRFDPAAWDLERRHVAKLRAAKANSEQDAENARTKRESEQANADFERQRAQLARESERAREEEERQLARIVRETEQARIEYERRRQLP